MLTPDSIGRRVRAALAAACGLLLLGSGTTQEKREQDLKKWIDGPVRYIARKEEAKLFRDLETDEARAVFIEKFWRRRDPTPESLGNEYRELFWRRVQEANNSFVDSSKPGWLTDRGKIYILYGPPMEVETHDDLRADRASAAGVIRWIYQGRPGQRMDLNPVVVVAFTRDAGGEYRVSYDPDLTSVFFDASRIGPERQDALDKFFEVVGAQSRSELSVMLDLGRMQEVPPAEQVLLESVETMESYQTLPLHVQLNRYFRPDDGQPLAVINIDLQSDAGRETPAILARFVPHDAARATRILGEESFKLAEQEGYRVAQGRIALDPGEYTVTVVVADPVDVKTGMHRATLELPPPPQSMSFSDPVWAFAVEPVPYASLSSYDEPFHLGPFRVLPKIDSTYHRGATAKLFLQVFGAQYPFRATFQMQGHEDDGTWVDLGRPTSVEQTAGELAWEVPTTERWPTGEYRVQVEVVDAGQRNVSSLVTFTLD